MDVYTEKRQDKQSFFKDTHKIDLRNEIQQKLGSQPVAWFPWLFQILDLPGQCRVLELGCGTGSFWKENREKVRPGWNVLLSDLEPEMVRRAHSDLTEMKNPMQFLTVDSQTLPFPDESFDAVIAIGVLDLVPDLQQTLGEIRRVLRSSGVFLTTAGGKGHLQELEGMLQPFLPAGQAELLGGREDRFGLENGARLLSPYFQEVARHDYNDRLAFPSMQIVLDYVLSEQAVIWHMTLNKLAGFVQRIKKVLAQDGMVHVTVRKGAFLARKKITRDDQPNP